MSVSERLANQPREFNVRLVEKGWATEAWCIAPPGADLHEVIIIPCRAALPVDAGHLLG